jgi:SAM-dependent methyltransferase
MDDSSPRAPGVPGLLEVNRRFYDPLWTGARLIEPQQFNTWPLVSSLVSPRQVRLEVAPGLRPRLPLENTHFVDVSAPAVGKLRAWGANAIVGLVSSLPFPGGAFELVCAFDIVEHLDDEDSVWSELARVAAPHAALLLSVPLHPARWTAFDDLVGHRRRYEPQRLLDKLAEHGFSVQRSAAYGMRPRSSRLVDVGMWFLTHQRERAMWWYNRVFMPLSVRFQHKLAVTDGLIDTDDVDEVLLVCRKNGMAKSARGA